MKELLQQFLRSSTIHGFQHISSSGSYGKLSWILIVFCGFSGAGYLIYHSFDNWSQNPVRTTIETLPITEITFPNVTVCPPRGTYTNLNYDLMQFKRRKMLKKSTRDYLLNFAIDVIQEEFYKEMLKNVSLVNENKGGLQKRTLVSDTQHFLH